MEENLPSKFPSETSPRTGMKRPLNSRQLEAIDLRAEGNSWDQISISLKVTLRTLRNWVHHPDWDSHLEARKRAWKEEYENKFQRMMPRVAYTHDELLRSQSEAIKMRAVDSAHANYSRNIKEQAVQTEVEELKAMVLMLTAELKQQRAG